MEEETETTSNWSDTSVSGEVQFKISSMINITDSNDKVHNEDIADSTLPYDMVEYLEEFHDAPTNLVTSQTPESTKVILNEVDSTDDNVLVEGNLSTEKEVTQQMIDVESSNDNATDPIHNQMGDSDSVDTQPESTNTEEPNKDQKDVETVDNIMVEASFPTALDVDKSINDPGPDDPSNDTNEGDDDNQPMSRNELLKLIGNLNASYA